MKRGLFHAVCWGLVLPLAGALAGRAEAQVSGRPPEPAAGGPVGPCSLEASEERGLVIFRNFTRRDWDLRIGVHALRLPGYGPGEGFRETCLLLDPGSYPWQAVTADSEQLYLSDPEGDVHHALSVERGASYLVRIMSLNPMTSTLRYVAEAARIPAHPRRTPGP